MNAYDELVALLSPLHCSKAGICYAEFDDPQKNKAFCIIKFRMMYESMKHTNVDRKKTACRYHTSLSQDLFITHSRIFSFSYKRKASWNKGRPFHPQPTSSKRMKRQDGNALAQKRHQACGSRRSTFRKVLEYFPQSTIPSSSWHPSGLPEALKKTLDRKPSYLWA